jgi:mono/diheme cytochrome c family protein
MRPASKLKITAAVLLALGLGISSAVAEPTAAESTDCVPRGEMRGDLERGKAVHLENCAECHGETGKVDVIVMHMDVPPRDQSDVEYMKTLTDEFLYLAICRGGVAVGRSAVMPGWGEYLSDQEIKDLVAVVRSFSGT